MDETWFRRRAVPPLVGVLVGATVLVSCSSTSPGGSMMGGGSAAGDRYPAASCTARPASLPGSTVTVTLADPGMGTMMSGTAPTGARTTLTATPATVPSGQVGLLVDNRGWRAHELVVLPLGAGTDAGRRPVGADGKVAEDGALGEASTTCGDGAGDGIDAGSSSWVTITLPAGRYELVCNLANHYADGMHQELDVT